LIGAGGNSSLLELLSGSKGLRITRLKKAHLTIRKKARVYSFLFQYVFRKTFHYVQKRFPAFSKFYANHFPAVQLNQEMDRVDYALNFSSELVAAGFVLIVAVANIAVFNPFKAEYNHNDQSLAAALLSDHSGLNEQLYAKQNTVNTTIASHNGFISQAFADNDSLEQDPTALINDAQDGFEDNAMVKANPDSVAKLVSRQIQIYETKPFDTVYTVARDFGLTPQTIRETNGLPDYALKAGWFLIIPPVDGIVVQITNPNITLTDVANKYSADINQIVSYNGLEDAEDMVDLNEFLIVPGGKLPAPPAPKPSAPKAKKSSTPSITKFASISGNHKFAAGYCTDYVARKVPGITWGGNANRWIANSKAVGATVDRNPVAGAILVTNENRRYGHVAYIEKVVGSTVYFSEWNYAGLYKTTHRSMEISDKRIQGIIHP
jgi:surface antigen